MVADLDLAGFEADVAFIDRFMVRGKKRQSVVELCRSFIILLGKGQVII